MTDHKSLTQALTAFHAELPDVHKGSINPAFKSSYADLADITKAVLPKLAEHGLAWSTTPTLTEHGFVLAYSLTHTSGEVIEGAWPLPDPTKSTPQQLGSAVTYARRYSLSAVTGISPDMDDDGNAASAKGAPRSAKRAAAEHVDVNGSIAALNNASTVDQLRAVFEGFTPTVRAFPQIVAAKDARKAALLEPGVDAWATATIPNEGEQK